MRGQRRFLQAPFGHAGKALEIRALTLLLKTQALRVRAHPFCPISSGDGEPLARSAPGSAVPIRSRCETSRQAGLRDGVRRRI
jgi:hypothetical protein